MSVEAKIDQPVDELDGFYGTSWSALVESNTAPPPVHTLEELAQIRQGQILHPEDLVWSGAIAWRAAA